ncbi:MAG: tetratricopeptide repeat protein [Verrucomicrobiales bacterium]
MFSSFTAGAQENAQDYQTQALTAMKAGNWEEAEALLQAAVKAYDAQAPTIFGPKFGWFWYHLGFCQLKLQKYPEAMKSFQTCYDKYPNNVGAEAGAGKNQSTNFYHKMALLKWGDAAKGAGQWEQVIELYKKFLQERDPGRDKYQPGVLYINLCIAHFKLGNLEEGIKHLETAITNKLRFPTPNRGIMSGFHALVEAAVKAKNEAALLDFLRKNRAHIKLDPYEAYDFVPLFMKLAQDAKNAEMLRSTFELYALVPGTVESISDIKARLQALAGYPRQLTDGTHVLDPDALQAALADLEKRLSLGNVNEIYSYLNTAVLHEQAGNTRGAYACYLQLERYFPNAKIYKDGGNVAVRETNLYNLVRTASVIGEVLEAAAFGERFLKAFPDSEYVPEVQRMMLASLFWEGQYAKCIEVATPMLENLKSGAPSKQHDVCLFVLGGSHYYTGNYNEAQPLIDEYLKTYPEDKTEKHRFQAASYYQASNLTRLQEWTKAGALLDAFIKKYPDANENPYLPYALFDRANAHYAEEELEPALEVVTRIRKEFPSFQIMEMVYNLQGNIEQSLELREEAEANYLKALELAEKKANDFVAGEALYYLVVLIGEEKIKGEENPRLSEALPYYDKYFEKYSLNSPYRAQVAVAGLPAMMANDRADEGLERLQKVISQLAKNPLNSDLEATINTYTEAYLKVHSVEDLKDHYYNFPDIDRNDDTARALLRIAVIGVVEDQLKTAEKEGNSDEVSKFNTLIKVLFNDLKSEFNPKDLTNYILVSVGDFLREKTSAPQQAMSYYSEVVGREDKSYRFQALFGMADILGQGADADKGKAVDYLQQVYTEAEDKEEKERALYRMIDVLYEKGDHAQVIARAKEYLSKETGFRKFGPYVQLYLGQAYDQSGQKEEAAVMYSQIWGTNMGFIRVSAPAIIAWADIFWDKNGTDEKTGKGHRQLAYESLYNYIKLTGRNTAKMEPQDLELWQSVEQKMKQLEAHADVTPVTEEEN